MQGTNSQRIYCDSIDVTCTSYELILAKVCGQYDNFFFFKYVFMLTKATFI